MSTDRAVSEPRNVAKSVKSETFDQENGKIDILLKKYPDSQDLALAKKYHEQVTKLIEELESTPYSDLPAINALRKKIEVLNVQLLDLSAKRAATRISNTQQVKNSDFLFIDYLTVDFSQALSKTLNTDEVIYSIVGERKGYDVETITKKIFGDITDEKERNAILDKINALQDLLENKKPFVISQLNEDELKILKNGVDAMQFLVTNFRNYVTTFRGEAVSVQATEAQNVLDQLKGILMLNTNTLPNSVKSRLHEEHQKDEQIYEKLKNPEVAASILDPVKKKMLEEKDLLDVQKYSTIFIQDASQTVNNMNLYFINLAVKDAVSPDPGSRIRSRVTELQNKKNDIQQNVSLQQESPVSHKWSRFSIENKSPQQTSQGYHDALKSDGEFTRKITKIESAMKELAIMREQLKQLEEVKKELSSAINEKEIIDKYLKSYKKDPDLMKMINQKMRSDADIIVKKNNPGISQDARQPLVTEEASTMLKQIDANMRAYLAKQIKEDVKVNTKLMNSIDGDASSLTSRIEAQEKLIGKMDRELTDMSRNRIVAYPSSTSKEKADLLFEQVKFELSQEVNRLKSEPELAHIVAQIDKLDNALRSIKNLQSQGKDAHEKIKELHEMMQKYSRLIDNPSFRETHQAFKSSYSSIEKEIIHQRKNPHRIGFGFFEHPTRKLEGEKKENYVPNETNRKTRN